MLQEKKNKFKPIIQEELQEFAHKVDKIVEYLTFKKKEDRNIKPADPQIVKSQKYYQVALIDQQMKEKIVKLENDKLE